MPTPSPDRMHAAVVEAFGQPLVFKDYDIPNPGPGLILVKTEACGVCHTDVHAGKGDVPSRVVIDFA
jgi:alcohol dehydrogenase, propanol-preferring